MVDKIQKLTDYSHVRLRTEMYLGSRSPHNQNIIVYNDQNKPELKEITWVPALCTAFREAVDNAIDEIVGHSSGTKVEITYNEKDMNFSIQDDGRGIPIEWDEKYKDYLASMVVTNTKAGRNFDERGNVAGTNGIGISAVVFCSKEFELNIVRNKKRFIQTFSENPLPSGINLISNKPKIASCSSKTGTKVSFQLSNLVFPNLVLPEEFIKSRVFEVALSNPEIKVIYNGEQIKIKKPIDKFLFGEYTTSIIDIDDENISSTFMLVPNFCEGSDFTHSIVNNIPTFNGGVHVDTFKRFFYSGILSALEKEAKKRKITLNKSDISEGLLIYNITRMKAPDFDSQSKTRLINEWVGDIIKKHLSDNSIFTSIIKKNREWIDAILTRAEIRNNKKQQIEISKAAKSAKKIKVPNLMDASGKDRQKCILFVTEGLSAVSGMASVRDPDIHGGLGLRGKVLNVSGENPKRILDNSTLVDIMNSLGLSINEKAERDFLRYGKLYIACDMDQDGFNITSLLINFLYSFWPDLFSPEKHPFVYVFMTPFIIAEKGKQRKYWYGHNYHEFKQEEYKGWQITRAKGLGTLTKEDWREALNNLIAIPIVDDGNIQETLDLIFNNLRADDRKEWIGLN